MNPDAAPLIETERLLLRPPSGEDFDAYAAFMADEEATRHIGGMQPRAMAWRSFLTMVGAWQIQGFAMFSVIEKASGRWLGRVGPWQPEGWPGTEIGWSLVRDAWGHGYASEAAVASMDWAFTNLDWSEAVHTIVPDNRASIRVAKRLGSSLIRPSVRLPPPHEETVAQLWGQSRERWLANRA